MRRTWLWLYRHDIVNADGEPYMQRWVLQHPWGTLRIHKILRSDTDRALHDHPWSFWSFILRGSYHEVLSNKEVIWRRPGALVRRKATDLHRIVLERPAWTFVITGRKTREWGFQTPEGWVLWSDFEAANGVDNRARVRT